MKVLCVLMTAQFLIVASDLPPAFGGGISRYYHEICRALPSQMIVVAIFCNNDQFDKIQPFKIFRLRTPLSHTFVARLIQTFLFGTYSTLIAYSEKANLILFGHWYLTVMGPVIQMLTGLPFGVFLHGGELDRFGVGTLIRRVVMSSFEHACVIIVNSEYTLQEYRQLGGKNPHVLKLTPGVDTRRFIPSADCRNVLDRYALNGKRVLLSVSRLVERKGHDVVLKALPIIVEQIPQVIYVIVGFGPQEAHLRSLVAELGIADRVIFVGYVSEEDLPTYYNACDVFVMPSRQIDGREGIEGFGIVYLEANACGKPVIGGNSGGVAEAVQDGVTGLLVDPLDHYAVANAVIKLLCDPDLARRLGAQGRERAEREFAWSKQAIRLRNALEEALQ